MKFAHDGPDIPNELMNAHEDGKIVFFCGAGVSYPSGLPLFKGLVTGIYRELCVIPTVIENSAIETGKYDTAISLLESRVAGRRASILQAIERILDRNIDGDRAETDTHEALMRLAQSRNGKLRLVTTNFDRLFEVAQARLGIPVATYCAPLLPNPKNTWDGLVYLHGLIPSADETPRDTLVISSGDFGLAYLTERWAARFVSALFSGTSTCFVGYSIDDPIIRYITDALAADRRQGEPVPEMFAFVGCTPDNAGATLAEWRSKNVIPLLYNKRGGHCALHKTLRRWSRTYQAGVHGREAIINQGSVHSPMAEIDMNHRDRVIWALQGPNGKPAERFASITPPPPLEWLDVLSEPSSYGCGSVLFPAKGMPPPQGSALVGSWDPAERGLSSTMRHMGVWLLKHLNNPEFILWVYRHGGVLHPDFARQVSARLQWIKKIEDNPDSTEIDEFRSKNPDGVPDQRMRSLWLLSISGRLRPPKNRLNLAALWSFQSIPPASESVERVLILQEALKPTVQLSRPYITDDQNRGLVARANIPDTIPLFSQISVNDGNALDLFGAITAAIQERFRINCSLRTASMWADQSSPYGTQDDLVRISLSAWFYIAQRDSERARMLAESCWLSCCPTLRRVALVAFKSTETIALDLSVHFILRDDAACVWVRDVREELKEYLAQTASAWKEEDRHSLLMCIFQAVPFDGLTDTYREKYTLDALELLLEADFPIGRADKELLIDLRERHGRISESQHEDPDAGRGGSTAPHRRKELAVWLRQTHTYDPWKDGWLERCMSSFPAASVALLQLAQEGQWPVDYWSRALMCWSAGDLAARAWRVLGDALAMCPGSVLLRIVGPSSMLLERTMEFYSKNDEAYLSLCLRILALDVREEADGEHVLHPSFQSTKGLLVRGIQGNTSAISSSAIYSILGAICRNRSGWLTPARICITSNANFLLHHNKRWSKEHLPQLLKWSDMRTAINSWRGLISCRRISLDLATLISSSLLTAASHYDEFGVRKQNFADHLMILGMEHGEALFSDPELYQRTVMALPPEGRTQCARFLLRCLRESTNPAQVWRLRLGPLLASLWPGSHDESDEEEFFSVFAEICIEADDAFSLAFAQLKGWLRFSEEMDVYRLTFELKRKGVCAKFPIDALAFLDLVCPHGHSVAHSSLSDCLDEIVRTDPTLGSSHVYIRLRDLPD